MSEQHTYFVKGSNGLTNSDAKVIGPVLAEMAKAGPVTARAVVEVAHSENSPLHPYFEWDDKKAAEAYRVGTARDMIRTVRVRVISESGGAVGLASQKLTVRPYTSARQQEHLPTIVAAREKAHDPDHLMERSLDPDYYPQQLEDALDIIDNLRSLLRAATDNESPLGGDFGLTKKEGTIYQLLKQKGFASKEAIYTVLYGLSDDGPDKKIIDVFICKLRRKLPPGETIETIRSEGWKLVTEAFSDMPKRRFTDLRETSPERVNGLDASHPAVREARTLFPSTVISPGDSPQLLVSGEHSRKLGSHVTKGPWSGFPIYQLSLEERATCPKSCFHWRTCYGNGMQLARRHRNDEMLIPVLHAELTDLQDEFPRGFVVRLHVLGDFFSKEYVDEWASFLDLFPALHVFGYTAWPRDSEIGAAVAELAATRWDRFAIRFSASESAPEGATTIWRAPEASTIPEGIVCPAQTGKTACCGSCGLCWAPAAKDKTVVFIAHGPKKGTLPERDPMEPLRAPTRAQLMAGKAR